MSASVGNSIDKHWDQLGDYLRESDSLLLPDEQRAPFLQQWEEITKQRSKLDDALLIGLVGGTGVGKSTFINALAGEAISRSSDRRPTTDRVVVYRHVDTELPADVPTEDISQPQVMHKNPDLTKAILFDFPDFDSAEQSHHLIIKRYIDLLDVLLIVVDDLKYADRRLYELLSSIDHDAANLFVLFNKVDRLENRYEDKTASVVRDLLADVRLKMQENASLKLSDNQTFPMAAKLVMDARIAGASADTQPYGNSFTEIEKLLTSFQAEKYRRVVKERNIDAAQAKLAHELSEQALGEENESILTEVAGMITDWRGQIDDTLRGIPVEVLSDRDRRGLSRQRLRRAGSSWGLPFSLLFTLMFELRRGRFKAPATELTAMGGRIFQHYRGFLEAISNLRARFESELVGSTIDAALQESVNDPVDRAIDPARLGDELAREFQRNLSTDNKPPRVVSKLACHVPALVALGLAVWSRLYPILASVTGESDRGVIGSTLGALVSTLSPTFVIGTLMGVVLVYVLTGLYIWLREVQQMENEIHQAEVAVRETVASRGGQVVEELDKRVGSLRSEFERLKRLLPA